MLNMIHLTSNSCKNVISKHIASAAFVIVVVVVFFWLGLIKWLYDRQPVKVFNRLNDRQ